MVMIYSDSQASTHSAPLQSLSVVVAAGVHRLELLWKYNQDLTDKHISALAAAVGQHITHLKLMTPEAIPDRVWQHLWAAFPKLQHLELQVASPGDGAAFCAFCTTAPHTLEVAMSPQCYRAAAAWLDSDLSSTRVRVTPAKSLSQSIQ
jgi:hypothetical protein